MKKYLITGCFDRSKQPVNRRKTQSLIIKQENRLRTLIVDLVSSSTGAKRCDEGVMDQCKSSFFLKR
jgi:hypothetical protein